MTSLNISQILIEAKSLAGRLKDDDKSTEALIHKAQSVNEKITCLKEYKENLNDLHEMRIAQKPRSVLVHNLQQENRQIKILQEENRQLKASLEEHQATVELIMKRYRQQVAEFMKMNRFQSFAEKALGQYEIKSIDTDLNCLARFASLFDQCMRSGEEAARKDQQELVRLRSENEILRRLLKITNEFGNSNTNISISTKTINTEAIQSINNDVTSSINDSTLVEAHVEDISIDKVAETVSDSAEIINVAVNATVVKLPVVPTVQEKSKKPNAKVSPPTNTNNNNVTTTGNKSGSKPTMSKSLSSTNTKHSNITTTTSANGEAGKSMANRRASSSAATSAANNNCKVTKSTPAGSKMRKSTSGVTR